MCKIDDKELQGLKLIMMTSCSMSTRLKSNIISQKDLAKIGLLAEVGIVVGAPHLDSCLHFE